MFGDEDKAIGFSPNLEPLFSDLSWPSFLCPSCLSFVRSMAVVCNNHRLYHRGALLSVVLSLSSSLPLWGPIGSNPRSVRDQILPLDILLFLEILDKLFNVT